MSDHAQSRKITPAAKTVSHAMKQSRPRKISLKLIRFMDSPFDFCPQIEPRQKDDEEAEEYLQNNLPFAFLG